MRLGVLTTSYPRDKTDLAGCFVADLSRELARVGDEVEVLAAAPARQSADDRAAGVRVRGLRYALRPRLFYGAGAPDDLQGVQGLLQATAFSLRLVADAALSARSGRWQALISHWLLPCSLAGASVAPGLPHLCVAHGSDVELLARLPGASRLLARLAAAPRARLVLTSESLRAPLSRCAEDAGAGAQRFVERGVVERMGVNAAPQVPAGAAARVRQRLAISAQRPVVLVLARLVSLKGIDVLIDASVGARYALVVAGEGPQRAALEARARQAGVDARFVGLVRGPGKQHLFAAADLLAAPSRRDSAPVTLLEALCAGLPVVASDVGGNGALLGRDSVVPPGDPRALRSAIEARLCTPHDPSTSRALAAPFLWPDVAARLRALLTPLSRGPPQSN